MRNAGGYEPPTFASVNWGGTATLKMNRLGRP
jgi:hypothetical protein